jgi:N-acetylmuramoyl-L-alanine amidase
MGVDYSDADVSNLKFKDIDSNSWVAKVVVKASELGMIDSSNANFRPNDSVTRAEAMKMLLNSASIEVNEVTTSSFADVKASGWEAKYIESAKNL